MALFRYSAKDQEGRKFVGEVEAVDERAVIVTLQKQELVPIEVKRRSTNKAAFKNFIPTLGVSSSEIVDFTRQLSTMISAGLPLTDALVILEKQTRNQNFARVLGEVIADVEGGSSLSQALVKHNKIFDVIYVKLVEAGETGGVLDKVLNKLAETLEKDREFKSKTRGAFIYPAIVVSVMVIVIIIMMIFVIPKLTTLYKEIGASLPLPTKVLIALSNFMVNFWWLMIAFGAVLVLALRFYAKTEIGSAFLSKMFLSIPIWGKIRKSLILAQFTRTLGLLIGAGIPIITALKVVAGILASPTYKESIDFAIERVEHGSPFYQPLAANPAFPPIIAQMVRVGEETGKMDDVLMRLSVYFESESENLIRNLTVALEPVILVILGVGVGVLVLSVILPIYNLTAQF
ncbi:type II secretion system F family protein [Candidatus Curtissbacteria bacterium]|nr:type II secretion system F family protein [Candidatus Curtissbacteria bacterium]